MPNLTIADRRAIMTTSMLQPDFRDLLRRDPRGAAERVSGKPVPEGTHVSAVEEGSDAWEFVVPATPIDADLPMPNDARGVVENDVYALLRDEPQVRARVLNDPKGFLADRLQFDIGSSDVNVREEQPGELLLIIPFGDSRDELNDSALDMVTGGGDPGSQNGSTSNSRNTVKKS
jgi:hypothetical protein